MKKASGKGGHHGRGLLLIAAFKLVKGVALLAVGIGALKLLHKDVAEEVTRWVNYMRVDPENVFIHRLLKHLANLDDRKLRELSVGTFVYSALLLTEGIGLALRKRWAEYFTVIMTSSLIPLEIWEIVRHASAVKVGVLVINVAIVVYLSWELRRGRGMES